MIGVITVMVYKGGIPTDDVWRIRVAFYFDDEWNIRVEFFIMQVNSLCIVMHIAWIHVDCNMLLSAYVIDGWFICQKFIYLWWADNSCFDELMVRHLVICLLSVIWYDLNIVATSPRLVFIFTEYIFSRTHTILQYIFVQIRVFVAADLGSELRLFERIQGSAPWRSQTLGVPFSLFHIALLLSDSTVLLRFVMYSV